MIADPKYRERAKYDRALALSTFPEMLDTIFFEPVSINLLILAGGRVNFTEAAFGLSIFLDALLNSHGPGPHARFATVDLAHRRQGFRFDLIGDFDPDRHDVIWILADDNFGQDVAINSLSASESFLLKRAMDNGKGVFATGDHGNIGASMCGNLPRIGVMRNWADPDPLSNLRKDTLRKGASDTDTRFNLLEDEADKIPQEILPEMFEFANNAISKLYPHPLLDGAQNVIKILPDHGHEGSCNDNPDLTKDFPSLNGSPLSPQIVARSQIIKNHETIDPFNPNLAPTTGNDFVAISAYDGHKVDVGRVVVDSSFHHFTNRNLTGLQASPFFDDLKRYFQNIGVWLAPKGKQRLMFEQLLWLTRWLSPLAEKLLDIESESNVNPLDWRRMLDMGTITREMLSRSSSPSLSLQWALDLINELSPQGTGKLIADPWQRHNNSTDGSKLSFNTEAIVDGALGGAVLRIAARFPKKELVELEKVRAELRGVIADGIKMWLAAFLAASNNTA